jgi:hypothetical protein
MNPSEKFVTFAAECTLMAKFTHTPEDKAVWRRMSERWLRCAELYDQETAAAHYAHLAKRHRTLARGWGHEGI